MRENGDMGEKKRLCWEHVLKFDTQTKFRWDACLKRIFAPGMTEHSAHIAQDALHMDKTKDSPYQNQHTFPT